MELDLKGSSLNVCDNNTVSVPIKELVVSGTTIYLTLSEYSLLLSYMLGTDKPTIPVIIDWDEVTKSVQGKRHKK
jgi:hypothetical protein